MNNTYAKAYTEVLTILKELPREEYDKIPEEEIKFYKDNCDKDYEFKIDSKIPLQEQEISRKANAILVSIFRDYFATEKQKEKLKNILNYNFVEEEKIKQQKYNVDDIFKNRKKEELPKSQEFKLVEYKGNFISRFINKIRSFFIKIFEK